MTDVLVISGSMGSGKTTVMAEASDLLAAARVFHAAIDLDALATGHFPTTPPFDLQERNLASLWQNYASAGIRKLLIAEALDASAGIGGQSPARRVANRRRSAW